MQNTRKSGSIAPFARSRVEGLPWVELILIKSVPMIQSPNSREKYKILKFLFFTGVIKKNFNLTLRHLDPKELDLSDKFVFMTKQSHRPKFL